MSYHLKPNGNPGRCRAKINCPFGTALDHFSSKESARASYEARQERAYRLSLGGAVTADLRAKRTLAMASVGGHKAVHRFAGEPLVRPNQETLRFEFLYVDRLHPEREPLSWPAGDLLHGARYAVALAMLDRDDSYDEEKSAELARELYNRHPEYVDDLVQLRTKSGKPFHNLVRLHDGTYLDHFGQWSRQGLRDTWGERFDGLDLHLDETPSYPERAESGQTLMGLKLGDYLKEHGFKRN